MRSKWHFLAASLLTSCFGVTGVAHALEPTLGRAAGAGMVLPPVVTAPDRSNIEARFDQVWEVVELMGRPVSLDPQQRSLRIWFRSATDVRVDGGCNRFAGRLERDAQGTFRVSKYTGTHGGCEVPPRSEAVLNSALVMADNFRWDQGLVLRSGDNELVRLVPSPNQDTQSLEPPARRPVLNDPPLLAAALPATAAAAMLPVAAAVPAAPAKPHCAPPPVKAKGKTKAPPTKAKASAKKSVLPVCSPAQMAQLQRWEKAQALALKAAKAGARGVGKSKAKAVAKAKSGKKTGKATQAKPKTAHKR